MAAPRTPQALSIRGMRLVDSRLVVLSRRISRISFLLLSLSFEFIKRFLSVIHVESST